STLGMIRGRESRRRALQEASRILGPSGRMALHVHNFWLNLRNSQGRSWLCSQAWRAGFDRKTLGDRHMTYPGIPGMTVHLYRWGELARELRAARFRIDDVVALDEVSSAEIRAPWLAHSIRAGGWIVFAAKR